MTERCCVRVYGSGAGFTGSQCAKPVKAQEGGSNYCAMHLPSVVKKRTEAKHARWAAESAARRAAGAKAQAAYDERKRRADCYDDLLQALQMLVGDGEMGRGLTLSERINNAKAVIAKATGSRPPEATQTEQAT